MMICPHSEWEESRHSRRREFLEPRDEDAIHDSGVGRREIDGNMSAKAMTHDMRFPIDSLSAYELC